MVRLGKVEHPVHGKGVRVRVRTWHGAVAAGAEGHESWDDYFFPRDQRRAMHPRHPTGYLMHDTGDGRKNGAPASFSPSLNYYADLCRFGAFSWRRAGPAEPPSADHGPVADAQGEAGEHV
jgi:hypothetical protein